MTAPTLERARAGDERAFEDLTAPHLRELHVHCYRMLGSLDDADDLLQETLVAAWRGLHGYAGRASLRTWLYSIATHRCLNAIRDRGRRPPTAPLPPFEVPAPTGRSQVPWLQPYPTGPDGAAGPLAHSLRRESVELAFVAAVQLLPPRQTAALLLVDVLGFTAGEVADMLGVGPTAVKGLLQRARARVAGAHAPPSRAGDAERETALARRFAHAFTRDDVEGVVALLTDDAWLAMPPATQEYRGRDAVAAFLRASATFRAGRRFVLVPTRANGQAAFGCYLSDGGATLATDLVVLTTGPDGIARITRFLDGRLHRRFGLPEMLPADPARRRDPQDDGLG